jgi:hypothetical protein
MTLLYLMCLGIGFLAGMLFVVLVIAYGKKVTQ